MFCNIFVTISTESSPSSKPSANTRWFHPQNWQQKIFTFPHLDIRFSRLLEDNATPADRAAHIDPAYWLIKYLQDSNA